MISKITLEKKMQNVHKKTHKPSCIENSGKGLESEKGENDNNNITKKKKIIFILAESLVQCQVGLFMTLP